MDSSGHAAQKALDEPQLTRAIALPQATAMVVGIIVGSAIFMQPSDVAKYLPSVPGIFLAWLAAGVLTLFGALICAELSSTFPNSGGVYVFLRESFGRPLAFLWGWAMFWTMHSGIIAAIATGFARYLGELIALDDIGTRVAAIAVIVVLSAINMLGVREGSQLQTAFTAAKLLAIVAIIVVGVLLGGGNPEAALRSNSLGDLSPVTLSNFGLAVAAGLFAFGGWHMVTYSAGETVNARQTLPRALVIGTLIVTACYLALNAVYLYILPLDDVATSKRAAADAARAVVGDWGGRAIAVLVMISTFGAVAGVILTGPRVYYAMAHDGVIFRSLGEVHRIRRTPGRVIVAQAVWSSVLAATGTYGQLVGRVIYTEWIFFGLMAIGLIRLRRRTHLERPYSVWGYPFVPVLFAAAAFAVVANKIYSSPQESVIGLSFVIVGLPVYYLWVYFARIQTNLATEDTEVTKESK
jgi:APA family basic amino acid/polyamine antiporter